MAELIGNGQHRRVREWIADQQARRCGGGAAAPREPSHGECDQIAAKVAADTISFFETQRAHSGPTPAWLTEMKSAVYTAI
jgi:hypothetical protein